MIGKLSGIIDSITQDQMILDVNGVGYVVHCSPRTMGRAGSPGDAISLLIDTHVREDAFNLYGFIDAGEQHWFRLLYSVQGVGPKAAMAILGVCPPEQIGFAIASGDKAAVQRADGVGPKLAARIVTELKDKAAKMDMVPPSMKGVKAAPSVGPVGGIEQDAVSALVNLGYQRGDAFAAVHQAKAKANDNEATSLSDIIRLALKELSA
jgi:Holliday junction DNA helicase RuvA